MRNEWALAAKGVKGDLLERWLPDITMTIISVACGGAIGYFMNTTKGIIIGSAIGLTVAIWVIAYLMIRHIPPRPETSLQEQMEIGKSDRNASAPPIGAPLPELKQDEQVKQQNDKKHLKTSQSRKIQEQPNYSQNPLAERKKEVPDNVPKYEVTLLIPSQMSDADIFVDEMPAVIIDRQLTVVKILVKQKTQPTKIHLYKGEQKCAQTLLIHKNMELTPCQ